MRSEVRRDLVGLHPQDLRTKYMCREGGCGACMVTVRRPGTPAAAINSCLVSVTSCDNWEITTIEKVGNKLDGYHPLQTTLAEHNGTQCGYCTPGWIMSMYSQLPNLKNMTMLEIEKSLGSNICRCTGYRPILDAFKTFGKDAPKANPILDIEDLTICKKTEDMCYKDNDWCFVTNDGEIRDNYSREIVLKDGKKWFKARDLRDIYDIFNREGDNSYMLVAGNTSKGVYPILQYPNVLIDISGISKLKEFVINQNLIIGAGTTLSDLLEIFERVKNSPAFSYLNKFIEHLRLVAHIAVRNLATIGGNLMIKRQHKEFPSDLYLLFETVGAQMTIMESPLITRKVSMQHFLNVNVKRLIILNVSLPPLTNEFKIETFKVMPRSENAVAIINADFLYRLRTDNRVVQSRIVYGGLASNTNRAIVTEKNLIGQKLFTNETLQTALKLLDRELLVAENPPEPSAEYRKQLALSLFYKSLLSLCPVGILKPRYRSGAVKLHESRQLSLGRQLYDTNPKIWPLNKPVQKVEALIQCSGEAFYTDDLSSFPREVFAAFVLSTVPTGNIISINAVHALNLPGVVAFYTVKDIPGENSFTPGDSPPLNTANEEVLCTGSVKYYDQPLGIIVAETARIAEIATKLVEVKYENVKVAVTDLKIAMEIPRRVNLYSSVDAKERGNDIFKVIQGQHTIYSQYHFSMETLVCVSIPTEEGLKVYSSSQWINGVQVMISRALKLPQNKIDVYARRLGGAFGIKITRSTQVGVACSLVTHLLNRPCRFITSLPTTMRAIGKRLPCSAKYQVAVNKSGAIQYVNENVFEDNGYMYNEPLTSFTLKAFTNCYNESVWNYKCYIVLTDTASNSWCRCPGTLESVAMAETIIERIAYDLNLDPLEVRLANLSSAHEVIRSMVETVKVNAQYEERKVAVLTFNANNRWKKRGLRFSVMKWTPQGEQIHDVNLSVYNDDGSIVITHGGTEMGQGINTKAVQVAAYMFKVPMEKIQIKANDTIIAPNGYQMTAGSMTSMNISIGVQRCCQQLLERLAPVRNEMRNPTWEELIKRSYLLGVDLQAHGFVTLSDAQEYYLYGVTLAEVEVDVLTGESEILRIDLLQDVGRSVSPGIDIGQVEGAFVMGIGYWTSEKLVYEANTGRLLTDRSWNYKVPQARDIPQDFRVYFKKNSFGPVAALGAKGTAEPSMAMSVVITFAIREALTSARMDAGIPRNQWFEIDGPWTVEQICLAAQNNIEDFKFY